MNQLDARQQSASRQIELNRHRRSTKGKYPKTAKIELFGARKLRQRVEHRRRQKGVRYPLFLNRFAERPRAETWHCNLQSAKSRSSKHRREISPVKYWRSVQIGSPLPISHPIV